MLWRSKGQAVVIEGAATAPAVNPFALWWRGFLVNLTNPKGLIFFMSLLTPFVNTANPVLPQYAEMGLTCGFTDFCVMTGVSLIAEALSKKLRNTRNMLIANRIFGTVFIAIGLGLMVFDA